GPLGRLLLAGALHLGFDARALAVGALALLGVEAEIPRIDLADREAAGRARAADGQLDALAAARQRNVTATPAQPLTQRVQVERAERDAVFHHQVDVVLARFGQARRIVDEHAPPIGDGMSETGARRRSHSCHRRWAA